MTKSLKIVVFPPLHDAPWVKDLGLKGHDITLLDSDHHIMTILEADLILGPTCCRFLPGMEKFLPAIIKGARAVKYPPKKEST